MARLTSALVKVAGPACDPNGQCICILKEDRGCIVTEMKCIERMPFCLPDLKAVGIQAQGKVLQLAHCRCPAAFFLCWLWQAGLLCKCINPGRSGPPTRP